MSTISSLLQACKWPQNLVECAGMYWRRPQSRWCNFKSHTSENRISFWIFDRTLSEAAKNVLVQVSVASATTTVIRLHFIRLDKVCPSQVPYPSPRLMQTSYFIMVIVTNHHPRIPIQLQKCRVSFLWLSVIVSRDPWSMSVRDFTSFDRQYLPLLSTELKGASADEDLPANDSPHTTLQPGQNNVHQGIRDPD